MAEIYISLKEFRKKLLDLCEQNESVKQEIGGALQELKICAKKAKHADTSEPQWYNVLLETLLSIIAANSKILRHIVKEFFPNICEYITGDNVHIILDMIDMEQNEDPLVVEDDSDDDDDGDDDNDDDLKVNEQLRMETQKILMTDGNESVDVSDMDENDAELLDEQLSKVFKSFASNSTQRKKESNLIKAKQIEFRVKVFDLLEVYVKSKMADPVAILKIQHSVLNLFESCCKNKDKARHEPLKNRCRALLKIVEKKVRVPFKTKSIWKLFKDLLEDYCNKVQSSEGAEVWSDAMTVWIKMLDKSGKDKYRTRTRELLCNSCSNMKKVKQRYLLMRLVKTETSVKFALMNGLNFSKSYNLKLLDYFYKRLSSKHGYETELRAIESKFCSQFAILMERGKCRAVASLLATLWKKRKSSPALDWRLIHERLTRLKIDRNSRELKIVLKKVGDFLNSK